MESSSSDHHSEAGTGGPRSLENQRRSQSRLTVKDGAMLGAGMMCVSAAALAYRAKRTAAFKLAYFLAWPVLGTAILTVWTPNQFEMEQELRKHGMKESELEGTKRLTALQLEALKDAAQQGKQ